MEGGAFRRKKGDWSTAAPLHTRTYEIGENSQEA
jgi:hypothetical protein